MDMKNFQTLFMAIGFLLYLPACKSTYPTTAEVQYLGSPTTGLIKIDAVGYGTDEKKAEMDVYRTAFNTILFRGLPAFSPLQRPMIENESAARSKHAAFFQQFFEERGYLKYITERSSPSKSEKTAETNTKIVRQTLVVNYDALRRDLEQNGVIRKFGL